MRSDFWNQRQPLRPFPKLWETFSNEIGVLTGQSFEVLDQADRLLATHGVADAYNFLQRMRKQNG